MGRLLKRGQTCIYNAADAGHALRQRRRLAALTARRRRRRCCGRRARAAPGLRVLRGYQRSTPRRLQRRRRAWLRYLFRERRRSLCALVLAFETIRRRRSDGRRRRNRARVLLFLSEERRRRPDRRFARRGAGARCLIQDAPVEVL